MSKPRLLDLFCGAGGAAMGYHRAGFEVVGVDIKPQPRYPFRCITFDAMALLNDRHLNDWLHRWGGFDAIHASPPCQRYSQFSKNIGTAGRHPDLLAEVRTLLEAAGIPWVIENVPGAPVRPDIVCCGSQFGLPIVRHRWFEMTPRPDLSLGHPCCHVAAPIGVYGNGTPQWHRKKLGRNTTKRDWENAMGIDWMNRAELSQAIPPAYTEFVGRQFLRALEAE